MRLHGYVSRLLARVRSLPLAMMQSGLTPQKLALTLCLGSAAGVMPLLWGTTFLCALIAARFRLSQTAIQAVNYCCYPLQLALFLPFCRLGELIFPWGPAVRVELLMGALHGEVRASLSLLVWATARGVGAWFVTAFPLALLVYPALKWVLCTYQLASPRRGEEGRLVAFFPLPGPPPPGEGS